MARSWSLGLTDSASAAAPAVPATVAPAPSSVFTAAPAAPAAPVHQTRRQALMSEAAATPTVPQQVAPVPPSAPPQVDPASPRPDAFHAFLREPGETAEFEQPAQEGRAARGSKGRRTPRQKTVRAAAKPPTFTPRKGRGGAAASVLSGVSILSMIMLFIVGMYVPANALLDPDASSTAAIGDLNGEDAQSLAVSAEAQGPSTHRDGFNVVSYEELMRLQYGSNFYTFTPTTGAVRWPFPYSVPISSGWGDRVAPCYGCSSFHKGIDFNPGDGTPIYAIAAGVVTTHDDEVYGFGNWVTISHTINGQPVDSVYAHMQHGSSPLKVGDRVEVGDFIGLVGSTGASTGAHLHFEVHPDGVAVNPYEWLTKNATNKD